MGSVARHKTIRNRELRSRKSFAGVEKKKPIKNKIGLHKIGGGKNVKDEHGNTVRVNPNHKLPRNTKLRCAQFVAL